MTAATADCPATEPDLHARLLRQIADTGPMPVAAWMAACNVHYYATRDPLGVAGDFITAPEISQMFGELVGLTMADAWHRAGRPAGAAYVELGPGRGTLAADALRAMARAGCLPGAVHLVETSPVLRTAQARAVPGAVFHDSAASLPADAPLLIVANEFFDALPVRQLVRAAGGWRERMVGLADGEMAVGAGTQPFDAAIPPPLADAPVGTIVETAPAAAAIMRDLAGRLARQGGMMLAIDYGYVGPAAGDTLQAVRGHAPADPFAAAGEADLTAHVDFAALADAARAGGARVSGPVGQGDWLRALGIDTRAAALARAAPDQADAITAARQRLAGDDAMGQLFKVLGIAAPGWPDPAGVA